MAKSLLLHIQLVVCTCLAATVQQLSGFRRDTYLETKRLIENLTNNYEVTRDILPTVDPSTPIKLEVELSLRQISTVDEVNQAIRLTVWLRLYWNNPFLMWNSSEYGNVSSIHLDNDKIWKPDIALYNKASLEEDIDILYKRMSTAIVVKSDGNCTWLAPITLLAQCKINVARFPFDEQECLATLGSWTHHLNEINVTQRKDEAIMEEFIPNGEWKVLAHPLKRNEKPYWNSLSYPDVTLYLRIQRRPLYYTLNLIIPCTLISTLAFLSFMLPTDHGERVSLVITVLLAMSVYMLIVSSSLPQTSDAIPVIGKYFLCIIVEIALCLFVACFVAKLREHEGEIPKWVDRYVNKRLARLLFMDSVTSDYQEGVKIDEKNISPNGHSNSIELTTQTLQALLAEKGLQLNLERDKMTDKLTAELTILADDARRKHKREAKSRKWRRTANVLDRFFLLLFSLMFVILTIATFA